LVASVTEVSAGQPPSALVSTMSSASEPPPLLLLLLVLVPLLLVVPLLPLVLLPLLVLALLLLPLPLPPLLFPASSETTLLPLLPQAEATARAASASPCETNTLCDPRRRLMMLFSQFGAATPNKANAAAFPDQLGSLIRPQGQTVSLSILRLFLGDRPLVTGSRTTFSQVSTGGPTLPPMDTRRASLSLVMDRSHYENVTLAIARARTSVWVSTANVKQLMTEAPIGTGARARGTYIPILDTLQSLCDRGVVVRILHATPPSRPFREELAARAPRLARPGFEMRLCPRVHLKMIAIDGGLLYLGSANFTGAGLGAKGDGRRNFEMGVLTDDEWMLDAAQARFDELWRGLECASCRLRRECPAPIDTLVSRSSREPARDQARPRRGTRRALRPG
jgi:hypothetical protein